MFLERCSHRNRLRGYEHADGSQLGHAAPLGHPTEPAVRGGLAALYLCTFRMVPEVILAGMTHRVGPKGQVVIPKDLRDALGIEPGDEVSFWREDDHVALRPARTARPLRGRFRNTDLVDVLEQERAADRQREDAR